MKPICVKCGLFYHPKKNGIFFTEGMPRPGGWRPYKVWQGDLWICKGCNSEIIVGCGYQPITEHYLPNFETTRKLCGADKIQINDC